MRPSLLLSAALTFSSLSAAFSWSDPLGDFKDLQNVGNPLYRRQNDNDNPPPESSNEPEPTPTDGGESQPAESDPPQETGDAPAESSDPENSDRPSETDGPQETERPSRSQTRGPTRTTGKPRKTEFDERLPAGGVSMQTPGPLAAPYLYKIGDYVTFAWNYTSLSVTPSFIDILATCTGNQATYTLAVNQSAEETSVLWDTGGHQETGTPPLLTEKFTLIIYDSESSVSATPQAGYLGAFNQFVFGMYEGKPYEGRDTWQCSGCTSGALSQAERQSLFVLATAASITVLSFTWFASGFGLL